MNRYNPQDPKDPRDPRNPGDPQNPRDRQQSDWTPADTDHLRHNSGYQLHDWGQSRGRNAASNRNEGYMEDVWNRSKTQPSSQGYGGYQRIEGYNPYDRNRDQDYGSGPAQHSGRQDYHSESQGSYRDSEPTRNYGDHNRNQTIGAYNETRSDYADRYQQRDIAPTAPTQSFRGKGPKGYTRADHRIEEDVCERLSDDHYVDARDVTVTCTDGVVTLQGSVDSRRTKHRIEDIVDSCRGVKDIHNELRVGSSTGSAVSHPAEVVKETFTPDSKQRQ